MESLRELLVEELKDLYTRRSRRAAGLSAKLTLGRIRQLLAKHRIPRWTAEQIAEILLHPWPQACSARQGLRPV